MSPLTFGSLFAGIGGFDLGFERAGFECRWQVEIDNYATKILEKHWPKVHRERDIRECNASNLGRVDCIIGGFPCQDISYAGRGAGLAGERSGLFFEAIRLVRELQPRAVVLENVAALLTRGMDRVLGTLAEIGYDAEWHCIPAAAVGAPHIRDRVFVIATMADAKHDGLTATKGEYQANKQQQGRKEKPNRSEQLKGGGSRRELSANVAYPRCELREPWSIGESSGEEAPHRIAETNYDQRCGKDVADAKGLYAQGFDNRSRKVELGRSSWWAIEPAVGELVNGVSGGLVRFRGRVATGIPNRVDKLRCLGNAIVPQVAEVVARITLQALSR